MRQIRQATVTSKRPVNLDITTFKLPPTAYASILHRASGVVLFFSIPILLWMLSCSLQSPESFAQLQDCLSSVLVKLVLSGILAALIYHLVAGIRHLFMDAGYGETKQSGVLGAKLVIAIALVLTVIVAGILVW